MMAMSVLENSRQKTLTHPRIRNCRRRSAYLYGPPTQNKEPVGICSKSPEIDLG